MIISRNLSFFDKNGHNLNLNRLTQQEITVSDITGFDAVVEAVTNNLGIIISLIVINGGTDYTNPTINVRDLNTDAKYSLQSPAFIKLNNGVIESIILDSTPANFTYPAIKYDGNLFFEEISTGLIENQHIFITEKLYKESNSKYFYSYPRYSINESNLKCSFEKLEDEEIFLFNIDYDNKYPQIEKVSTISYALQEGETEFDSSYVRKSTELVKKSIQVNLGLSSIEEGIFEKTLIISEELDGIEYPFVEILLRGETEGEDERFKMLLHNFGIIIGNQEEKIFRDSDVNEALPNYTLLNQKRKEMLLENHNIYPYLGSYKALVNIINYFDYFDLGLREYWLNVDENAADFGKYKHVNIPIQLSERGQDIDTSLLLPKTSFKKTSLFGLFFDINKTDGSYDEYGIPNVVDNFVFTIDEILIKLFGLKQYLKNKFLPLNARIIDITGEGIYFDRFAIKAWKDDNNRLDVEFKREVDFISSPENLFIVDLIDYKDNDSDTHIFDIPATNQSDYIGNYLKSENYPDQKGISVGCPLTLDLDAFNITWDETQAQWDELDAQEDAPHLNIYTWDNLGQGEFYELDWFITFEDPTKFSYNERGSIEDLKHNYVILPFDGDYLIEVVAIDLNNFKISHRKNIIVKLPNTEFISFSRYTVLDETWDELSTEWNNVASEWVRPSINHDTIWNDFDLAWDSLDMDTYKNQESPFSEEQPKTIKRIFEKDRKEGKILSISENIVELENQLSTPPIKTNEFLFFKKGDVIKYFKVLSSDYSGANTIVTFEPLTSDINTSWVCYREIRGIIIEGNHVYNKQTNIKGLQAGSFISLKPNNTNNITAEITDVVTDGTKIIGVEYDTNLLKYPGEYVIIYRNHNEEILPININVEEKTLQIPVATAEKLIVGFSIIELTYDLFNGDSYTQRLLIENITNYLTYSDVLVKEIDSDLNYKFTYIDTTEIEFKYDSFQSRLIFDEVGLSNTFNLDFNFYPYPTDFVIGGVLNGVWFLDYRNKSYNTSFEVLNSGFIGDDTFITVNDVNKLLYLCSPSYEIYWKSFNEVYANQKFGTNNLNWLTFNNVTWEELDSHLWEQFDYHGETLCGYKITQVSPNGKIRFNENDEFEFLNLPAEGPTVSLYQQLIAAVDELNNSDSPSVNGFAFQLVDLAYPIGTPGTPGFVGSPGTLYIQAVAKNPGVEHLGYLVFENGIEGEWDDPSISHTYPIGNFKDWRDPYLFGSFNYDINWDSVPQTYYIEGIDTIGNAGWYPKDKLPTKYDSIDKFWESYRLLYDRPIAASFTWNELVISNEFLNLPKMSTVFFKDDNCKIAGKTKRIWRVYEKESNKLLIESDKDFFIWTFSQNKEYNIELEITDSNGNVGTKLKEGYISTLNYE